MAEFKRAPGAEGGADPEVLSLMAGDGPLAFGIPALDPLLVAGVAIIGLSVVLGLARGRRRRDGDGGGWMDGDGCGDGGGD